MALLFRMIFTASGVYQVTTAGLSALQLVLVGTTLEAAVFLFEVPTGVVADVFSRRLSIVIGVFLIGLGFLVEGAWPLFWTILLAQVLWGLGYTFTSGATQAWISDEIGESRAGRAFLRSSQLGQIASLLGIGLGVLVGSLQINLPILLGGAGVIMLSLVLAVIMPETGFSPLPDKERNSWQKMLQVFRTGLGTVRNRPTLTSILAIGLIYGLYSEGLDRLWTKHLLDNFRSPFNIDLQPVVWIGVVRAVGMLLSASMTEIAHRKVDTDDQNTIVRVLTFLTGCIVISLLVFAISRSILLALVVFWLITISRNVISPLYTAWVNRRLESGVRATVLSMSSQVDAIGQISGGPVVGLVGNLFSVRAALLMSGMILSPALLLFHRLRRHGIQEH